MVNLKGINLALLKRSILFEMRNGSFYIGKVGVVLIIALGILNIANSPYLTATGMYFYNYIIYSLFLIVSVLGFSAYATQITIEKNERTLPLLLMTGISPFSLLVSQVLSSFISGCGIILMLLPFTLLSITFGGVSIIQILLSFLLLIVYLFAICCIAIFASTVSRRDRGARGFAFLIILFFHGVFINLCFVLFAFVFDSLSDSMRKIIKMIFQVVSPFYSLSQILSTTPSYHMLFWNILYMIIFGLIMLGLAICLFEYSAARHSVGRVKTIKKGKLKRSHHRRVWNKHALFWKSFTYGNGGKKMFIGKIIIYSGLASYALFYPFEDVAQRDRYDILFVISNFVMFFEILRISALFALENKNNVWVNWVLLPGGIYKKLWSTISGYLLSLIPGGVLYVFASVLLASKSDDWAPLSIYLVGGIIIMLTVHYLIYAGLERVRGRAVLLFIGLIIPYFILGNLLNHESLAIACLCTVVIEIAVVHWIMIKYLQRIGE